jgi:hypothetical protein
MAKQILMTDSVQKKKKPTKSFLLSLLGGVLIFGGAIARIVVMLFAFSSVMPNVIDPAYVMLKGIGAVGGLLSYVLAAIEAVSGICVIVGALMIHRRPAKAATWGNLILAGSFVSFVGTGGFMLGAVLGIVGGAFALIQKPNPPRRYYPSWLRRDRPGGASSG